MCTGSPTVLLALLPAREQVGQSTFCNKPMSAGTRCRGRMLSQRRRQRQCWVGLFLPNFAASAGNAPTSASPEVRSRLEASLRHPLFAVLQAASGAPPSGQGTCWICPWTRWRGCWRPPAPAPAPARWTTLCSPTPRASPPASLAAMCTTAELWSSATWAGAGDGRLVLQVAGARCASISSDGQRGCGALNTDWTPPQPEAPGR